ADGAVHIAAVAALVAVTFPRTRVGFAVNRRAEIAVHQQILRRWNGVAQRFAAFRHHALSDAHQNLTASVTRLNRRAAVAYGNFGTIAGDDERIAAAGIEPRVKVRREIGR